MREKLIELLSQVQYQGNAVHGYSDKYIQNGELADHLIANGVTVQQWIPVTERLPELFESCFVVVKLKYDWEEDYEYGVDSGYYVGENGYIDGFNTFNDWNEGQQHLHVTHWMPLPKPPKEG